MILFEQGAIDKGGFNGPYVDSTRQKGFVSYGASHVMRILGSAEVAQRSSWYHKWNVHMYARPEVRFHYVTNHYANRRALGLIRGQPSLCFVWESVYVALALQNRLTLLPAYVLPGYHYYKLSLPA